MIFAVDGHEFKYELEKVARLFTPFTKFRFVYGPPEVEGDYIHTRLLMRGEKAELFAELSAGGKKINRCCETAAEKSASSETEITFAKMLYEILAEFTGYKPPWGVLTGIRPARFLSNLSSRMGKEEGYNFFINGFLVTPPKAELCCACLKSEDEIISRSKPRSFSLYISIPFCPSRCNYCSFVSHSVENAVDLIPQYIEYLCKEIEYTAKIARQNSLLLETVYIGGGTPTTLSAQELDTVMSCVDKHFDMKNITEYTAEAGRPDTVTAEKLKVIKAHGVTRISINPQTMNNDVLKAIGRRHTAEQTVEAYRLARSLGFNNINMDLIAGLQGDCFDSFKKSVDEVIALGPENVTVHTLSFKRASALNKEGSFFDLTAGCEVGLMVDYARETLAKNGIYPYYMYRQGKTVGNLENVGYSKPGYEGQYNVYIMDETHTILACGASAVTKLREPQGDYIERIFNYKYPYEYIRDFDLMLSRKNRVNEFYEIYG